MQHIATHYSYIYIYTNDSLLYIIVNDVLAEIDNNIKIVAVWEPIVLL